MLQKAQDLEPDQDAVGCQIRRFAWAFQPMDDEMVAFNSEMPEVEFDKVEINLPAS